MSGDELAYLSIREASDLLRSKSLSPIELLEAILARIEAHDGTVMAYLHVASESARAQARAAEQALRNGTEYGPLCGIPVAIKDIVDVAGMPTTAGSRVLQGHVAHEDADLVALLRAAGAIMLGKTNTHEFAYGVITAPTRNPWDASRIPGGSSGGSAAALAAGMAPGAIGTDTAGSIRLPSALCGVVGLKPTYGRVPTRGVIPLSWSLDHAGPMARTVGDAALLFDALTDGTRGQGANWMGAGSDISPDPDRALRGLRAGVPCPYFFDGLEPAVANAAEAALGVLQALGVELVETSLPNVELTFAVGRAVQRPEASAYHRERLRRVAHLYGAEIRNDLEVGELLPAVDHVHAQRVRAELYHQWLAVMDAGDLDVLLTPTVPVTAPPVEGISSSGVKGVLLRNTYPFNLVGFPALSVPCGFDAGGLPIGLQIVARPGQERAVLRVGAIYEAATPWHERRPTG